MREYPTTLWTIIIIITNMKCWIVQPRTDTFKYSFSKMNSFLELMSIICSTM